MSISKLFQELHGMLDVSRLQKLMDRPDLVSKDDFKKGIEFLKVDAENIYFDPTNSFHSIIYYDGFTYISLYNFSLEMLKMARLDQMIFQNVENFKHLVEKKDYVSIFRFMDKKIVIPGFIKMYTEIPDEDVYDIFIDLYVRSEYGFPNIPKHLLKTMVEKRQFSNEWKERMEKLSKKTKNTSFKVYRGMTDKSTDSKIALSWTLKKSKAQWFANRFNSNGWVETKHIFIHNAMDYLNQRGEEEILILNED